MKRIEEIKNGSKWERGTERMKEDAQRKRRKESDMKIKRQREIKKSGKGQYCSLTIREGEIIDLSQVHKL